MAAQNEQLPSPGLDAGLAPHPKPGRLFTRVLRWAKAPVADPRVGSEGQNVATAAGVASMEHGQSVPDRIPPVVCQLVPDKAPAAHNNLTRVAQKVTTATTPRATAREATTATAGATFVGGGVIRLLEVDLERIDSAVRGAPITNLGTASSKYASFLLRALCIASKDLAEQPSSEITIEVVRHDAGTVHVVQRAPEMRMQGLARTLSDDPVSPTEPATLQLELSTGSPQGMALAPSRGERTTVSLVHLGDRPVAITDAFGVPGISVHSMGMLSVAVGTTGADAEALLCEIRDILENRDWALELD